MRLKVTIFACSAFAHIFRSALLCLLNQGETWLICSEIVRAGAASEAQVRALTLGVRTLKRPCEITLVTGSHELMLAAATNTELRHPDLHDAWEEFDRAIKEGDHILTSGQGNPDHLVIQAGDAVAQALAHDTRPAEKLTMELKRVAPALLKLEEAAATSEFFVLRLNLAARGSMWLSATGELEPFLGDPRAGTTRDLVRSDQLAVIRGLGRTHTLDIEDECQQQLHCETGDLSEYAASWFIAFLRKRAEGLATTASQAA